MGESVFVLGEVCRSYLVANYPGIWAGTEREKVLVGFVIGLVGEGGTLSTRSSNLSDDG